VANTVAILITSVKSSRVSFPDLRAAVSLKIFVERYYLSTSEASQVKKYASHEKLNRHQKRLRRLEGETGDKYHKYFLTCNFTLE